MFQVTVLLKECRDIQLRCGLVGHDFADNGTITAADEMNAESNSDEVISERLVSPVVFPSAVWLQSWT